MDKCREQFEKWAVNTKDQFGVPFFTIKNEQGKYVDHGTEISRQAWQASRQALVIELPKVFDAAKEDASYYEYAYLQPEVEKALDAAGVAYK